MFTYLSWCDFRIAINVPFLKFGLKRTHCFKKHAFFLIVHWQKNVHLNMPFYSNTLKYYVKNKCKKGEGFPDIWKQNSKQNNWYLPRTKCTVIYKVYSSKIRYSYYLFHLLFKQRKWKNYMVSQFCVICFRKKHFR